MSEIPTELKYAKSHEWLLVQADGTALVGITDHAQDALGDVVFVELPEVGREVTAGEEVAVVESVKAASDIYSPVSGVIVEINSLLEDEPEQINTSPYDDAWFFKIELSEEAELDELMSSDEYEQSVEDS